MWQQIALAAIAVAVIFLFGPGAKRMAENSPSGTGQDWWTFAKLIGGVILVILLMILFLRQ
ncbi:hypothetical protein [Thiohalorhabdus sp.]|uniref:hypothetical protein n=1 Tax=Thiohalorhabdus sp. TaxID=3094134 RepID=UPI002FC39302